MPSNRKISIFPLLAVSFISTLGFGIVLPSVVYIVQKFHGGNFLYGVLGATYSAFQFFGAPILGKLSDRFGRKRILFVCVLGSAITWALLLVALGMPVTKIGEFSTSVTGLVTLTLPMLCILIARAVNGLTAGDVSVANAYVADVTTPETRKADYGKMGISSSLGYILGPALAGMLGETALGLTLPFSIALATSLFALVLIVFFLPESHSPRRIDHPRWMTDPRRQTQEAMKVDDRSSTRVSIGKSIGHDLKEYIPDKRPAVDDRSSVKLTLRAAFEMPQVSLLIAIYFVFFLAFSLFAAAMPLYVTELLHWSISEMGILFSVLAVLLVITEGPVLAWFNKRVSAEALTIWGAAIVALGYFVLVVPGPVSAYATAVMYAIGNGLMWPSFLSLLSDRAGEQHQGYIQGLGNSAGSLASIAGLLMGGILFTAMRGSVFIVPAALVMVVFLMSWRLRRKTV